MRNNADEDYRVETTVQVGAGNNSPVVTLPPIRTLSNDLTNATFPIPATDFEGDALSYRLATSAEMGGSSTNPAGLTINPTTGFVTWTTMGKPAGLYNAAVAITDSRGAKVVVDFLISVQAVPPPAPVFDFTVTPSPSTPIEARVGQAVNFNIRATDMPVGSLVSIMALGMPAGATLSPASASGNPVQTTFSWTPTNTGSYVITFVAEDSNGNQTTTSVTINVSNCALTLTSALTHVSNSAGNNGAIDLSVSGGTAPYTYNWSNGSTTQDLTGLMAGTYNVTVVDATGACRQTASYTINPAAACNIALTAALTHVTMAGGGNGAVNLTVTGGTAPFTYAWSNGATTQDLTGLMAGNYSVTVKDATGCQQTASYTINPGTSMPVCSLAVTAAITHVTAAGGSNGAIDVSVSGGMAPYTYMWTNGSTTQDLTGLMAGTYTVTVMDASGTCQQMASFIVNPGASTTTCANTGGITYEYWANVPNQLVEVSQLPANMTPTSTSTLPFFSAPADVAENYFARVRGYLCVPVSGMYRFHLTADDRAELYLSTDDNPANKVRIASLRQATMPGNYTALPTQQSGMIQLQAGQRYYIEAVMREFGSRDHMTVAWTRPDGVMETIPAANLVPFTPAQVACPGTGSITYEFWANVPNQLVEVSQLPANTAPTSTSNLPFFSAPANVAENYFARMRGYLCVPMSGMYRFHLPADDRAELYLSTDDNPANKVRIASLRQATMPGNYSAFPTQQSGMVMLQAGQRYYIEAVMREFGSRDHITVAWTRPDGVMETISGANLIPYTATSTTSAIGMVHLKQEAPGASSDTFTASPNPFADKVNIGFSVETEGDVTLQIYNMQGQLVKSLHAGKAEAGRAYQYEFDGSRQANGVYICKITVAGKTTVKRLLLNR
ncbi:PA14 domain-containing protein [Rufibacter tibetensis]|uniref:PA14 domain-containing protein n=1 Tax=Rufibacter tibetensis TaxID=512763 RepID=UPI0014700E03|nr:PA14 domain-containing protein [Rufibacter tibetensis]